VWRRGRTTTIRRRPKALGFAAVSKDLADQLVVPAGYAATVIYATGDSIDPVVGDYRNDGSDDTFSRRSGDHHDGMHWFGLAADGVSRDPAATDRALLCMNHENIAGTVQYLHPAGQTTSPPAPGPRPKRSRRSRRTASR
jgi:secreted PhoX family phosphatase